MKHIEIFVLILWQFLAMALCFPAPSDGFDHIPSTPELSAALHIRSH